MWLRRKARYRDIAPLTAGGKRMSQREYDQWYEANTWHPGRDAGLEIADDLSPADWLGPQLHDETSEVRSFAPDGFADYARIFFPFTGDIYTDADGEQDQERITWAETAARNGRARHALMEAETIAYKPDDDTWSAVCLDDFGPEQLAALLPVLARNTSSQMCWYLLWYGHGLLNQQVFGGKPTVSRPIRDYYLLHGPLDAYDQFPARPDYCWPEDRAWCLCGDVDLEWCYLAASKDCIDDVVVVPVIDAIRTRPEDPAHKGMDVINDPDGLVPRSI